jgi:anti-sigma factor RsiW
MQHIPDDSLELYALGRLSERELAEVEEHLLRCPECVERLDHIEGFTKAMRDALRESGSELVAEHQTAEGPIRLYVRRLLDQDHERWVARIRGPQTDCGIPAFSRGEALAAVENLFREMYREHRCGPVCITNGEMRLCG